MQEERHTRVGDRAKTPNPVESKKKKEQKKRVWGGDKGRGAEDMKNVVERV